MIVGVSDEVDILGGGRFVVVDIGGTASRSCCVAFVCIYRHSECEDEYNSDLIMIRMIQGCLLAWVTGNPHLTSML